MGYQWFKYYSFHVIIFRVWMARKQTSGLQLHHPRADGPELYKKADCRSHEEKANKKHPSTASASVPDSRFLSCLSSCHDFFWWCTAIWKYKSNKPSPSQLALWSWSLTLSIQYMSLTFINLFSILFSIKIQRSGKL